MIFAYFGPETVLPLASIVATVFGVAMMFGRMSLRMLLIPFRWLGRSRRASPSGSILRGPSAWRRGADGSRRQAPVSGAHEEA